MIGNLNTSICTCHRDEERARWLRKKLEEFRVPKHLIGKTLHLDLFHQPLSHFP